MDANWLLPIIKSGDLLIGTDLATEDEARLYLSPISAEELALMLRLDSLLRHWLDDDESAAAEPLGGAP